MKIIRYYLYTTRLAHTNYYFFLKNNDILQIQQAIGHDTVNIVLYRDIPVENIIEDIRSKEGEIINEDIKIMSLEDFIEDIEIVMYIVSGKKKIGRRHVEDFIEFWFKSSKYITKLIILFSTPLLTFGKIIKKECSDIEKYFETYISEQEGLIEISIEKTTWDTLFKIIETKKYVSI